MIGSGTQGWATTLADLAIILFMITAADLANADLAASEVDGVQAAVATAEPVALYRPRGAAMSLSQWLEGQPGDPRQRLTILVRHDGTQVDAAIARGVELAGEAEKAGRSPRVIVEKAGEADLAVILAYDSGDQAVARNLLEPKTNNNAEDIR